MAAGGILETKVKFNNFSSVVTEAACAEKSSGSKREGGGKKKWSYSKHKQCKMIYNPFLVWMEFAVMMSVSGGKKLNYTKGSAFLRNLYISCRQRFIKTQTL